MAATNASLEWEAIIPLVTNPFLWLDFVKALVVALTVFGGIVVSVLVGDDRPAWAGAAGLIGSVIAVVVALFLLVELAVFRNRLAARFLLDESGASYVSGRAARRAQRVGLLVGALAGSPLVLGGSLLAAAAKEVSISWAEVRKVTTFPRWHVVTLSNSWRPVLRLYCPNAETYDAALRFIGRHAAATLAGSPLGRRGPGRGRSE